jgi:predicted Zn-dependent peptidase
LGHTCACASGHITCDDRCTHRGGPRGGGGEALGQLTFSVEAKRDTRGPGVRLDGRAGEGEIEALTLEAVRDAFQKHVDPKKLVIIRAGDFPK